MRTLPSSLFEQQVLLKVACTMRATFVAHFTLFDFIIRIVFGGE
jgi:hypothetical protein